MALITNSAEGAPGNGTTVTIGNSGGASGTAFVDVNSGVTYTNAQKAHGTWGYAHAGTAATFNTVTLGAGDGTTTGFSVRCYVRLTGYPSAETSFITVQTAGSVSVGGFNLDTTGHLKVVDTGSPGTFTTALSLNTWYRVSIWCTIAAGTATMNASLYALDDPIGSHIETHTYTSRNTGSTAAGRCSFGKLTNAPSMATYYFDDLAVDFDRYSEIGPVANTPPTVDAGVNQNVSAGATVNLSASASDPDGSIASHAWTFDYPTSGAPALTGASTATPSFTAGSAGSLYVLRDTVTDNGGATASDTVEVRVPTTGNLTTLDGYPPTGTGSWTNVGGAANEGAALADASDATYVEGPAASATEANRRYRLTPSTARSTATITARVGQDVAGTISAVARLYEGTTLRETFNPLTTSTTPTDRTLSLAPGTVAAITDWGNLYLEVAYTT